MSSKRKVLAEDFIFPTPSNPEGKSVQYLVLKAQPVGCGETLAKLEFINTKVQDASESTNRPS